MIFFLISSLPFLLYLFSKSLPLKPLPRWAHELGLLSFLLLQESAEVGVQWLRDCRLVIPKVLRFPSRMSTRIGKKCALIPETENSEEMPDMTILDLPELTLDCILGKLSPVGLCSMASVCTSLKDMCRSDHLWERYMREKWGRVIGPMARRELECYLALKKNNSVVSTVKPKNWIWPLSCFWSSSWFITKDDGGSKPVSSSAASSIMSFYVALESGRFWFPAQVYNRENGHVGFMLSCYDAELSYDCRSDTFQARYPPHGQRAVNVEEAVPWERLRAPPVDTPAYDLHVSDCLGELWPGDHIEIQWRKNTEFPYGWWYGVVGHLELCDGNEHHCHCLYSDTIILEFSHYTPGSRWRKTAVNRKDHKEEGNEIDGFYGGIRKLYRKEEISAWRRLWPSEVLA